jgi:hypothetical protein
MPQENYRPIGENSPKSGHPVPDMYIHSTQIGRSKSWRHAIRRNAQQRKKLTQNRAAAK